MKGIKVNLCSTLFFVAISATGCREPTPCEVAAALECEKTKETIAYFNEESGAESYIMEDCLKLIPLRCPVR